MGGFAKLNTQLGLYESNPTTLYFLKRDALATVINSWTVNI